MKFGASIWPFQWDPPYKDGISRVASLGFEAVELIGWNRELLQEYYTSKKVEELRAFVEDAGLEISEFVSTPEGMASPDDKERDRAVEHFKRAVEVAVGLGTGIVNTVSAYPFDLKFPRACYELGQKSHRNADFTVDLVPSRSLFPAFLSRF
jgi:sugar phosphate isomerase/epimerase